MAQVHNGTSLTADGAATVAVDGAAATEAAEKAELEQKYEDIYNNYATPLVGTFLNLTKEPAMIKCPACGQTGLSHVSNELKWWAMELNQLVGCCFVTFCLCCCFNFPMPCKKVDWNHYCANCGCYYGRAMKYKPLLQPKKHSN